MGAEAFGMSFQGELDFDQWRKIEDGTKIRKGKCRRHTSETNGPKHSNELGCEQKIKLERKTGPGARRVINAQ